MHGSATEPDPAPEPLPARPLLTGRAEQWLREPRALTIGLAIVALIAGAWWVRTSTTTSGGAPRVATSRRAATTSSTSGGAAGAASSTTTAAVVVVDVVGAVRRPGVVSLPASARVVDAVNAAGGVRPDADAERLDLAAHLVDGERIAVPRRGAAGDPASPTGDQGAGATGDPTASDAGGTAGPVNLNTASQAQLEALPGIGPSLAQAIIAEREREGGFHSVSDLRRVHGIGDVRFAQLQPLVTV